MLDGKTLRAQPAAVPAAFDRSLLSNIALLQDLRPDELAAVEQVCRYRRFSAQELIVDRDSPGDDVFFIVRGRVRIVNYSVAGREVAFDDVGEGSCLGELPALDGLPRPAAIIALTDTLVIAIPGKAFLDVLRRHPAVALRLLRLLAATIRHANERIMDLSTLDACSRVQAEVLRQAKSHQVNGNAAVIYPIPVHSDIASRASTTRETVARVLNGLARQGLIQRTRQGLLVHDLRRLDTMVNDVRG